MVLAERLPTTTLSNVMKELLQVGVEAFDGVGIFECWTTAGHEFG